MRRTHPPLSTFLKSPAGEKAIVSVVNEEKCDTHGVIHPIVSCSCSPPGVTVCFFSPYPHRSCTMLPIPQLQYATLPTGFLTGLPRLASHMYTSLFTIASQARIVCHIFWQEANCGSCYYYFSILRCNCRHLLLSTFTILANQNLI